MANRVETHDRPSLPGPLVSGAWLSKHLDDVVVVDVRWYLDGRSGREAYRKGHIPGAVWADLDADLSSPPSVLGGRHPLPTPAAFARAMQRLGVSDDSTVVAYDDAGGAKAARLWFMLDALDVAAAVLDGGLAAWTGTLAPGHSPAKTGAAFTPRDWPSDRFASADETAQAARASRGCVLDARAAGRFRGEPNNIDPRFGHIPGARSAPWEDNLDGNGCMRDAAELREHYADRGALVADEVIAYCGSGVTACHDALALRLIGVDARVYVGSWSAWGADPDRPRETGPAVAR